MLSYVAKIHAKATTELDDFSKQTEFYVFLDCLYLANKWNKYWLYHYFQITRTKIHFYADNIASIFNFNLFVDLLLINKIGISFIYSRPRRRSGSSIVVLGGDSIEDYINSDNIDHFHRLNDGTYRETPNDLEMLTMMSINQDNGKFSMSLCVRGGCMDRRFSHTHHSPSVRRKEKGSPDFLNYCQYSLQWHSIEWDMTTKQVRFFTFLFQWQRPHTFRSSPHFSSESYAATSVSQHIYSMELHLSWARFMHSIMAGTCEMAEQTVYGALKASHWWRRVCEREKSHTVSAHVKKKKLNKLKMKCIHKYENIFTSSRHALRKCRCLCVCRCALSMISLNKCP